MALTQLVISDVVDGHEFYVFLIGFQTHGSKRHAAFDRPFDSSIAQQNPNTRHYIFEQKRSCRVKCSDFLPFASYHTSRRRLTHSCVPYSLPAIWFFLPTAHTDCIIAQRWLKWTGLQPFFSRCYLISYMSTSLQVNKDSQMKGKDDSITWQTYATEKLVILESVIREIVQRKDQVPNQLLEVANTILSMLSAISVIMIRL